MNVPLKIFVVQSTGILPGRKLNTPMNTELGKMVNNLIQ
jgi:hypothetical protein